ncbi:MAG: stage V sporulation protein T [Clostridiales bacterium]|nr:stage V sporulation protein T [Clostridiales bacterium]
MKATGIVRRIDELGRVVVPKEIRRTLRIREGDPLEIFTDRNGEIILKKYSPMGELGAFAKEYVEALNKSLGHIAMICDRDSVIATAGVQKKEYLDHAVSREMEQAMEQRKPILTDRRSGGKPMPITEQDNASQTIAQIVVPVISEGEATGAVVLLSRREDCKFGETELKVTQTTAGFLGRQLEQ